MIEFELLLLCEYLVGIELVECEKNKSKASAMSISKLLWTEWNEYERFQIFNIKITSHD